MMRIKTLLCLVLAVLPLVGMWKLEIAGKPQARGQRVPVKTETGAEILLYTESHALVIGVSEYQRGTGWGTLPGVKDDVPAVRSALEQHGFQVEVVLNPTGSQLRQALNQFAEDWGFAEGNRLVIYFAGHGYTGKTIDGREMGYIVPQDAPDPDQDNARFNKIAVSMKEIMNIAERVQAKHALFLFDSCFSGTLFKTRERVSPSIVQKTARPVREFITAGTAKQPVPDQSQFRRQFVVALNGDADTNRDGYVTASELGTFLEEKVTDYTNRAQTPQWGKINNPDLNEGDMVFALPKPKREGKEDDPVSVVVKPKPQMEVETEIPLGTLVISVNQAGVRVVVAGQEIGTSSAAGQRFRTRNVEAGRVEVIGRLGGKEVRKTVEVIGGQETPVELKLEDELAKKALALGNGDPVDVFLQILNPYLEHDGRAGDFLLAIERENLGSAGDIRVKVKGKENMRGTRELVNEFIRSLYRELVTEALIAESYDQSELQKKVTEKIDATIAIGKKVGGGMIAEHEKERSKDQKRSLVNANALPFYLGYLSLQGLPGGYQRFLRGEGSVVTGMPVLGPVPVCTTKTSLVVTRKNPMAAVSAMKQVVKTESKKRVQAQMNSFPETVDNPGKNAYTDALKKAFTRRDDNRIRSVRLISEGIEGNQYQATLTLAPGHNRTSYEIYSDGSVKIFYDREKMELTVTGKIGVLQEYRYIHPNGVEVVQLIFTDKEHYKDESLTASRSSRISIERELAGVRCTGPDLLLSTTLPGFSAQVETVEGGINLPEPPICTSVGGACGGIIEFSW